MGTKAGTLRRIGEFVVDHYKQVLFASLLITVVSAGLASRVELSTNFTDLLPSDESTIKAYEDIVENVGGASSIIVVIEGEDPERMKRFATDLGAALEPKKSVVSHVSYRYDMDFFKKYSLLYLDRQELEEQADMLQSSETSLLQIATDPSVEGFLRALNEDFEDTTRSGSIEEDEETAVSGLKDLTNLLENMSTFLDPVGPGDERLLAEAVNDFLAGSSSDLDSGNYAIDSEGYMFSKDRTMLLVEILPATKLDSYEAINAFYTAIENEIHRLEDSPEYAGISAGLAGYGALVYQEEQVILGDLTWNIVGSFLGVMLLLFLAFKTLTAPIITAIPLAMGILWTLALHSVVYGKLNVITATFPVMLIGLGIDYGIHLYSQYGEERSAGRPMREAISNSFAKVGGGIVTGALTTAVAFYAMMVADFAGLTEMGFMAGTGILMCLLAMFTVFPALLVWEGERAKSKGKAVPVPHRDLKSFEKLGTMIRKRPWVFVAAGVIITVFLGWSATEISFDTNLMNLEPQDMEAVVYQNRIIEEYDMSSDFAIYLVPTIDDARQYTRQLKGKSTIKQVDSIAQVIPDDQEYKISYIEDNIAPVIDRIPEAAASPQRPEPGLEDRWIEELDRLEMNMIEFQTLAFISGMDYLEAEAGRNVEVIGELRKAIQTSEPQRITRMDSTFSEELTETIADLKVMAHPETLGLDDLPEKYVERYVARDGRYIVYAYPKGNVWDERFQKLHVEELRSVDAHVTGTVPIWDTVMKLLKEGFRESVIAAFIAVFLLVLLDFRSLRGAVLTMTPLAVGVVWMVGILPLLGIKLNLMNVAAVPLIIGIGIDDGVHVYHRYVVEGAGSIPKVLRTTGKAVLFTTLTTMVGFGSLALAKHPGTADFGQFLVIGITCAFLVSIMVLPGMLAGLERRLPSVRRGAHNESK